MRLRQAIVDTVPPFQPRGPYGVDVVSYARAVLAAIADMAGVLGGGETGTELLLDPSTPPGNPIALHPNPRDHHHAAYARYIAVKRPVPAFHHVNLGPVQRLIVQICRRIGFTVRFLPGPLGIPGAEGFVSWISVNFATHQLKILYDPAPVQRTVADHKKGAVKGSVVADFFEVQKALSKVFLHECGHAVLHCDTLKLLQQGGAVDPSLPEDLEQEAWLYALTAWSILVGDHAYHTRTTGTRTDQGWMLV